MRTSTGTPRTMLKWAHIAAGALLIAFVYSPLYENYGFVLLVQVALVPALVLTGAWLSRQARLRRLLGGHSAGQRTRFREDARRGI